MFISELVIAGSAVAGSALTSWGVLTARNKKKSTLVGVMAPRTGLFGRREKTLVEKLTSDDLARPEHNAKEVDDNYQTMSHNTKIASATTALAEKAQVVGSLMIATTQAFKENSMAVFSGERRQQMADMAGGNGVFWGALLLSEPVTGSMIAALVLILSGVILVNRAAAKKAKRAVVLSKP